MDARIKINFELCALKITLVFPTLVPVCWPDSSCTSAKRIVSLTVDLVTGLLIAWIASR